MLKISILIPVRRDERLHLCLKALADQDYPPRAYEVVVVENDDACRYEQAVRAYGWKHIQETELGASVALHTGQAHCNGDILARLDADCVPVRTWLSAIAGAFAQNPNLGIVGGPVPKYRPESWMERNQRSLAIDDQSDLQYLPHISSLPYVVGANAAFNMTSFHAVGGYREIFPSGDDVDLCWRIQSLGYEIDHISEMVVYHHCRKSVRQYLRSFFGYSVGHVLLAKLHGRTESRRIVINWYPKTLLVRSIFWTLPKGVIILLLKRDSAVLGKFLFDLLEAIGLVAGGIVGAWRYRTWYL